MEAPPLPHFSYYAPSALGAVFKLESHVCDACGLQKEWRYALSFYSTVRHKHVCADCIADGHAAEKFGASYNDLTSLMDFDGKKLIIRDTAAAPAAVIEELAHRTPGYHSWQDNPWMFHCGDGCVFHGDASPSDVVDPSSATIEHWEGYSQLKWSDWMRPEKIGRPVSAYKFICRHCGLLVFHWDMS